MSRGSLAGRRLGRSPMLAPLVVGTIILAALTSQSPRSSFTIAAWERAGRSSLVSGVRGLASSESSDLYIEEGSITVTPTTIPGGATVYRHALLALDSGRISAYATAITGSMFATGDGAITLGDVVQTATPTGSNGFDSDSMLTTANSTLAMTTYLYGFAKALVNGGSLTADLSCSEGANAYHNGGTITGTVTGCAAWTP